MDNAFPAAMADILHDREDDRSLIAAQWVEANENTDRLWTLIGTFLDEITRHANGDYDKPTEGN